MKTRFTEYQFEIRKLSVKLESVINLGNTASFVTLTRAKDLLAPTFLSSNEIMNETSVLPLAVHILAACVCMGFSAIYHLFNVKNPEVAVNLARLDYAGIAFLIYGSAIPAAYYGFACNSVECKYIQIFNNLLIRSKTNLLLLALRRKHHSNYYDIFRQSFKAEVQSLPSLYLLYSWLGCECSDWNITFPTQNLSGPQSQSLCALWRHLFGRCSNLHRQIS